MRTFYEDVQRAVQYHGHLCSGQCIGVKIARYGMELLQIDPEQDKKRLMVFVECNRCPADSILMTTDCRIGRRTYMLKDFGKVAATFVDLQTGKAVRVSRVKHCHPAEGEDMIAFYEALPYQAFLEAKADTVPLDPGDYPGKPVRVVRCEICGEEVTDNRHVEQAGHVYCRACTGQRYYRIIAE